MNEKLKNEYGEAETIRLGEDSDPVMKRPVEVAAVAQMVNPSLPPARTKEQHKRDMSALGYEECLRCGIFKFHTEFSPDERNVDRHQTQTICKQCNSERVQVKRQVRRNGVRSEGYRYRERGKKRRKRK